MRSKWSPIHLKCALFKLLIEGALKLLQPPHRRFRKTHPDYTRLAWRTEYAQIGETKCKRHRLLCSLLGSLERLLQLLITQFSQKGNSEVNPRWIHPAEMRKFLLH